MEILQHTEWEEYEDDEDGETWSNFLVIVLCLRDPDEYTNLIELPNHPGAGPKQILKEILDTLVSVLGVPIADDMPKIADKDGNLRHCSKCGRNLPPHLKKCPYCGGPVVA